MSRSFAKDLRTHRTIVTRVCLIIGKISATDKDRNKTQPVEKGKETHLLHRHPRRGRALLRARSTNWKQAWIAAHWSLVKHAGPHTERSQHLLIVSFVIPDTRASRSTNRRSLGNSTHEENPLAIDPGSRVHSGVSQSWQKEDNERKIGREREREREWMIVARAAKARAVRTRNVNAAW